MGRTEDCLGSTTTMWVRQQRDEFDSGDTAPTACIATTTTGYSTTPVTTRTIRSRHRGQPTTGRMPVNGYNNDMENTTPEWRRRRGGGEGGGRRWDGEKATGWREQQRGGERDEEDEEVVETRRWR
jgi:hypothetical protein